MHIVLYSSKDSLWKLADFGLTAEGSSKTNCITQYARGTPGYRAPELLESDEEPGSHNNKVDIWAMGCILYELATRTRAFKTDFAVHSYVTSAKNKDVILDFTVDTHCMETITKYVVDMLQVESSDRPTASFLSKEFEHQWQVALDCVQLNTVTASITLLPAVADETEQTPTMPQTHLEILPNEESTPALPSHLIGVSLYKVAEMGDVEAVRTLLNAKVDVNARGRLYGNALQAASRNGHEAVVRLLLEKGAELNAQGGDYDNALQAASYFGHEAVVRLLLERGAEVNVQGGPYGTALQAASSNGHVAVVRLLLENGAKLSVSLGD
jgi:hypothetical protein